MRQCCLYRKYVHTAIVDKALTWYKQSLICIGPAKNPAINAVETVTKIAGRQISIQACTDDLPSDNEVRGKR
jgi:hypothetical protein